MSPRALLFLLAFACGCSAASPPKAPAPAAPRVPYEGAAAAAHAIEVSIDTRAAREILASLSRARFEASDAKLLVDLPAVRLALSDSNRPTEVFERDFAAAFDEESRPVVFDFRGVRQTRELWEALLETITARESELSAMASRRAAALLPGDRVVQARLYVYLTFGLAGLGDHLVIRRPDGREVIVVDLSRALGELEQEPVGSQLSRVARLIAAEAYRQAWAEYRRASAAWTRPDPDLGDLEPLLKVVAVAGPAAVFSVDEGFFPLSVWLKEPMRRSLQDLNRRAERLSESRANLEQRVELTAEIRRGDFTRRFAGPVGAFLADGVFQSQGLDALRTALAKGPRAFFQAYDRAAQTDRNLVPLAEVIRERLAEK